MFSRILRLFTPLVLWLAAAAYLAAGSALGADTAPAGDAAAVEVLYKEDINKDGKTNVVDAVALLLLGMHDPDNPAADYDGDGVYNITDVILLLNNIMRGDLTLLEEETYFIEGRVTEDGVGLEGIELSIDGPDGFITRVETDDDGAFRFENLEEGAYGVRPIIRTYYYIFDPDELEVTITDESVTLCNFRAFHVSYALSGRIVENGAGMAGVTLSLKGVGVDTTLVTDAQGMYKAEGLYNAPYAVVPTKENYIFNPYSLAVILVSDSTLQDITATPQGETPITLYNVEGRVSCSIGPLSNVQIILEGDMNASTVTDANGFYSFLVPDGSYTIIGLPIPELQMFNPPSQTFTVSGADVGNLDFYGFGAGL